MSESAQFSFIKRYSVHVFRILGIVKSPIMMQALTEKMPFQYEAQESKASLREANRRAGPSDGGFCQE